MTEEDAEYFEPDGCEQWELMKDRKNRVALWQDRYEWGWLQNKRKGSAADFALVTNRGYAVCATALELRWRAPGFFDHNTQKGQRGGRGVPFLTFILGYGLGMIVTLWIVIRNS